MFVFRDFLLPLKTNIRCSFAHIYGVGLSRADYLCNLVGIAKDFLMRDLSETYFHIFVMLFRKCYLTGDVLKHVRNVNFRKLLEIRVYRALRFNMGLPIYGQRTKTNAQTARRLNRRVHLRFIVDKKS